MSVVDTGEEDLVQRARLGDERAFEELYRRHKDWAASVAFRYGGNREDALDVLQDAFAYFFRRLGDYEHRASVRVFLFPVVKHLALNRKRARREPTASIAAEPAAPQERESDVESLLVGLSELHREVVCMRFVDGLDLAEIAQALEVPLGTVKSRLHHAIEQMRGRLQPPLPGMGRSG
jgi:RNA polymerase sigma-70 factor, ECF subfamily